MVGDGYGWTLTAGSRRLRTALLMLSAFGVTELAFAGSDSGALPTGNMMDADRGKVAAPDTGLPPRPKDCRDEIANPLGLPAVYESAGAASSPGQDGGAKVWWLARIAASSAGKPDKAVETTGGDASGKMRHVLYSLSPATLVAVPVAAMDLAEPFAMMRSKDSVSVISFAPRSTARCFDGPGTLLDMAIGKKTEGVTHYQTEYSLVRTPTGRRFFDKGRKAIMITDAASGQRMVLRKVPDGEKPWFYDEAHHKLLTLRSQKGKREIVSYQAVKGAGQVIDTLPPGTSLLQNAAGQPMALELRRQERGFKIYELTSWNGAGGNAAYKITLPRGFNVTQAQVDVDPAQGIALVTGESLAVRRKWQKAFVYRYRLGQLLRTVSFDGSLYPNLTAISPDGDAIFVEVRSSLNDQTVGGRLFTLKDGMMRPVELKRPPQ